MLSLFLTLSASESSSPSLTWQYCTRSGCTSRTGLIVVDKSFRIGGDTAAVTDYRAHVGVWTSGNSLTQRLVSTYGNNKFIGSRVYLLQSGGTSYEPFNFVGKEIAYDVDLSQLVCGVSASFYSVEMPSGGSGTAGATYGGGYCDANFVSGQGCHTFDFQHANKFAMQFSTHPCSGFSYASTCDGSGCSFNAYKRGSQNFWNGQVSTGQKITVVTQFPGSGTNMGEINRLYVQNGQILYNPTVTVNGASYNAITDAFCQAIGVSTSDWRTLNHMAESFARGHVLVFSLWDSNDMTWLDGQNGGNGPCSQQSKDQIEASYPGLTVTWSNLKFGELDTTY